MNRDPGPISRRSWLLGTLVGLGFGAKLALGDEAIEAIKAQARKAGMQPFDESETEHYRGVGDASQKFREQALALCELVAADYRKHFESKGFELTWPKEKLTVVILLGPKSYAMFEGGFLDEAIGGHFDLDTNRLVIFDFAGPGANTKDPIPDVDNTLQLVHETIHQLTFNTGVLNLKGDVPLAISEGFATYGETWRPRRKGVIGGDNNRRLLGLRLGFNDGVSWIPLASLLADDKPFKDPKIVQVAYAESWLFVHKMLKDREKLPRFRNYLAALREKPDPATRVEIARTHLGDLDKLDREIRVVKR